MNKFFTLTVVISLFFSFVNAEVVNKINISGNKRVSEETIKIYDEIEIKKNYSEGKINEIIKNLYSTDFFEDIQIELKNNVLNIKVKEYPIINQLIIIGEKSNKYKEQIIKLIQSKEKKSLIRPYLAKDIEIIKKLYSSAGYNSSNVDVKVKKIDEYNYDMVIEIDRGDQTKITSINFIGNNNIRSNRLRDIIASEQDKFWKILSKNTNLSENLIQLDKRLLQNYYKSQGYYDIKISSNIAELGEDKNAKLIYSIEEGKRYRINKISTNVDKVFDKKIFFPLNDDYKKYLGDQQVSD